jgi:hypothetical protein
MRYANRRTEHLRRSSITLFSVSPKAQSGKASSGLHRSARWCLAYALGTADNE